MLVFANPRRTVAGAGEEGVDCSDGRGDHELTLLSKQDRELVSKAEQRCEESRRWPSCCQAPSIVSTAYPPALRSRMYNTPKTMMMTMENGAT